MFWVSSNQYVYYVLGNTKKRFAPDVMVVFGIEKRKRRVYKLWEGPVPVFILEVTSNETKYKDTVTKKKLYERLGVKEYFLYDPLGEYLDPPLQGYRLTNRGRYGVIPRIPREV